MKKISIISLVILLLFISCASLENKAVGTLEPPTLSYSDEIFDDNSSEVEIIAKKGTSEEIEERVETQEESIPTSVAVRGVVKNTESLSSLAKVEQSESIDLAEAATTVESRAIGEESAIEEATKIEAVGVADVAPTITIAEESNESSDEVIHQFIEVEDRKESSDESDDSYSLLDKEMSFAMYQLLVSLCVIVVSFTVSSALRNANGAQLFVWHSIVISILFTAVAVITNVIITGWNWYITSYLLILSNYFILRSNGRS